MTGVGKDRTSKLHGADVRVLRVQRPELVLEALPVGGGRCDSLIVFDDVAASVVHLHQHHFSFLPLFLISWVELSFLYKPTSIHQPLPMVAPFQPRLDWQMWFAALEYRSSGQPPGWIMPLLGRLQEQSGPVLGLLDPDGHPDLSPSFFRLRLDLLTFAPHEMRAATGRVWQASPLPGYTIEGNLQR